MIVRKHEVNDERPDYGRNISAVGCRAIGEIAKASDPYGQFVCRRRNVQYGSVGHVLDDYPGLSWQLEPSYGGLVIERAFGDDALEIADQRRCQFFFSNFTDMQHRVVVVKDHPLVPGTGAPTRAQHLLGHLMRCGGTFELA